MQLLFNIILRALIWIRSICLLCSEVNANNLLAGYTREVTSPILTVGSGCSSSQENLGARPSDESLRVCRLCPQCGPGTRPLVRGISVSWR